MKETMKKEAYEKPVLEVITLKVDEVLALGCKTSKSGTGPSGSPPPCGIGVCSLPGS
jgi:hypothetical protein